VVRFHSHNQPKCIEFSFLCFLVLELMTLNCPHFLCSPLQWFMFWRKQKKKNIKMKKYKKICYYFKKIWLFWHCDTVHQVSHHFIYQLLMQAFCKLITYLTWMYFGICLCHLHLQGVLDCFLWHIKVTSASFCKNPHFITAEVSTLVYIKIFKWLKY
jgi:hypothetical protein